MPARKASSRNTARAVAQPSDVPAAREAVPAPAPPVAAVPVPAPAPPIAAVPAAAADAPGPEIFDLDVSSSEDEAGQQPAPGQASTGSKSAAHDINFFFNRAPQGSGRKTVCLACK